MSNSSRYEGSSDPEGTAKRTVLFYACAGGSNVGEITSRAAKRAAADCTGSMYCLAGLGAGIHEMIRTARQADLNVVIDGCPTDCAKKIFDKVGLKNYVQVRVTDLGIEKAKGAPVTEEQVTVTVVKAVGEAGRS